MSSGSGVPLWQYEEKSHHRGVPFVFFLGNIGGEGTLSIGRRLELALSRARWPLWKACGVGLA